MTITICSDCGAQASGHRACHCSTCHRTFSALSTFDQHRTGGRCINPAHRGLRRITRGGWTRWVGDEWEGINE